MKIKAEKVKEGVETFCDGTSLHGFREAFYSNSNFWTVIWLILVTVSVAMTGYQLSKAVEQYLDPSTNTYIIPATENTMYPPMKFCYLHWIYWIDWEKGFSMNFTKQSILFAMSFLTNVYTEESFNYTEAKHSFKKAMLLNNFTLLQQFYKAVAKPFPLGEEKPDARYQTTPLPYRSLYFAEMKTFDTKYWGPLHCYLTPGELVTKSIKKSDQYEIFLYLEDAVLWARNHYMSEIEYDAYLHDWFELLTFYVDKDDKQPNHNFSQFNMPILFYPDGYSEDYVLITDDVAYYTINMQIVVHRWLNRYNSPCYVDQKVIMSNTSDVNHCKAKYPDKVCKCKRLGEGLVTETDEPKSLHQYQIFVLNRNRSARSPVTGNRKCISYNVSENLCETDPNAKILQQQCINGLVSPCEVWTYSFSSLVENFSYKIAKFLKKTSTVIQTIYPDPATVSIMVETDRQTWEDFIGNVGGLLGVWTGASLLSVFQLCYLCCCASGMSPKFENYRRRSQTTSIPNKGENVSNEKL